MKKLKNIVLITLMNVFLVGCTGKYYESTLSEGIDPTIDGQGVTFDGSFPETKFEK